MITREFLSTLTFRVMTESDLQMFSGCESPVPLIAENDDYMVVIDGDRCEVFGGDFSEPAMCMNPSISNLPY